MTRRPRTPHQPAQLRRLAAVALGIPTALTTATGALHLLTAHPDLDHAAAVLRHELTNRAALAIVVYTITAATARTLHGGPLSKAMAPLVGGCVLTVAWVAEPVNANLMTHLPANPTWTAVTLLTLNTMALSSWWRCLVPNTPRRT